MGIELTQSDFGPADYASFQQKLSENLAQLQCVLSQPDFGEGAPSLGAELELYLADDSGQPAFLNQEIHQRCHDPQLTLEQNRYNLSPCALAASPLEAMESEMVSAVHTVDAVGRDMGGSTVAIGTLPTLSPSDFGIHSITERRRYRALMAQLVKRRGDAFEIDINGLDPLHMAQTDIALEGANTSFQVHYRVSPAQFANTFNAVQLVTPLVLAVAANSPTLFGHRLWRETRIPLFKQSIDTRVRDRYAWNEPARVNFGHGWVRDGAFELFSEAVRVYPPLLPQCGSESIDDASAAPALDELRLHQSTIWLWNRPVYDPVAGGHLRIEMRALPAGPSPVDMMANTALMLGLTEASRTRVDELLPAIPFNVAEYNFYRAAQYGLDARLVWPGRSQFGCVERPVREVFEQVLPIAREGLLAIGMSASSSDRYLAIIEQRLALGRSGADWQLASVARREAQTNAREALRHMLADYMRYSNENRPVHAWPL